MTLVWLRYVRYISALYYALEGATLLEFQGVTYSCENGIDSVYLDFLFKAVKGLTKPEKTIITDRSQGREG